MDRRDIPWSCYSVWATHADRVLVSLGLYHMHVTCVVETEFSEEDAESKVSHAIVCQCGRSM